MSRFAGARRLVAEAIQTGGFPAAVVEVGRHDAVLWCEPFGTLEAEHNSPSTPIDAVFDLASLTKVVATTNAAMAAVDRQLLHLTDPVAGWLPSWRGKDREAVTCSDLLAHASGLTAHMPFFRDCHGRAEFEHAICTMPLEYQPRQASVYSDLGFILLGFILEDAFGCALDATFLAMADRHGWGELRFRPPPEWKTRSAPTEIDPWRGRLLVGEVHDENAWALGGVAGHSGVFGTAAAVGHFARTVLAGFVAQPSLTRLDTLTRFTTRTDVPGTSRALGWDTMRPTSSCGTLMSPDAIGHTGFTGTSLWIDPQCDAYVVLLTNRVHPTRTNDAILKVRPAFHDAVIGAITQRPT